MSRRRPSEEDFQRDDVSTCMTCGRSLRFTDPGTLVRFECAECLEPQPQGPAVAFVLWNGVRLGFDSVEKAEGFIRINREANDPRYYVGERLDGPVLEVPSLVEAK